MPPLNEQQMVVRSSGIGGSEIAAVAGLNPHCSPLQVWLRKTGQDEREETYPMLRGTHLGPAVASLYEAVTGRAVSHRGAHEQTLTHPQHPIVRATPDGLVHASTRASKVVAVLECKVPSWRTSHQWGEPGTDQIPEHYLPQVTWEMACAGVDRADVVPLIGDDGLPIYTVPYSQQLFEALLHLAEKFWRDYVETGTPPPIDGSEAARDWLVRTYPRATADLVDATEEQVEMLRRRAELKASVSAAEDELALIDNRLIQGIAEHKGLRSPLGTLTMVERKGSPSWKRIAEALNPSEDIIKQHTSAGSRYPRWTAKKEG